MKLFRPNPESKAYKARMERQEMMTVGVVSCKKCGATHKMLYKVNEDPKEYLCVDCMNENSDA